MTLDQQRRLRTLQHEAATLSREIRNDRGEAEPGPGKAKLRAVGRLLETAVRALDRANERANA